MHDLISDYVESQPVERRQIIKLLIDTIIRLFPQAEVSMKYSMPTFEIGEGWVAVANQKNYVSLYTCSFSHIKLFKAAHPKIKTGTGCINFKPTELLPIADIEQVIRHAMLYPKGESA
jgi:uncharacterized protein YdhG (YjbR/CyaY superfamily)